MNCVGKGYLRAITHESERRQYVDGEQEKSHRFVKKRCILLPISSRSPKVELEQRAEENHVHCLDHTKGEAACDSPSCIQVLHWKAPRFVAKFQYPTTWIFSTTQREIQLCLSFWYEQIKKSGDFGKIGFARFGIEDDHPEELEFVVLVAITFRKSLVLPCKLHEDIKKNLYFPDSWCWGCFSFFTSSVSWLFLGSVLTSISVCFLLATNIPKGVGWSMTISVSNFLQDKSLGRLKNFFLVDQTTINRFPTLLGITGPQLNFAKMEKV